MKNTPPRKIFVTFGDGRKNIKFAAKRLISQAKKTKIFDQVILGNLNYLKKNCFNEYKLNINFISRNKKGLGYWIWKPILLKCIFENSPKNSIILYADSGCEFSEYGYTSLLDYFNLTKKKNSIFFTLPYHEAEYSKSDLFAHNSIKINNPDCLNSYAATFFFLKNTSINLNFIREWLSIAKDNNYHYLNDSESIIKNHPDFKQHRHDQSIMSCLVHKYKLNKIIFNYHSNNMLIKYSNYPLRRFFLHPLRNKSGKTVLKKNLNNKNFIVFLEFIFLIKQLYYKARVLVSRNKFLRRLVFIYYK
jgi:hypothetical protein